MTTLFYWKIFVKNLILFPGDLLVGAYFPWLEYKWGYAVGVPVKNPLISDIFSQFHIWKSLIAESYRAGAWPLWNPYSYSGYPLLANFNSGALNPFNLLMIIFGEVKGWNLLIVSQTLGSLLAFFAYLRAMKLSKQASIVGSLTYAFSGFALTWLPFVNVGFSFIWLALIFLVIEKQKYLLISPLLFLLMSAGHFQALVFGCLLFGFYFLHKNNFKNLKAIFTFGLSVILGILMMAIQMLPTLELMTRSVRFTEGYIADYSYGLLPITHILTLFAPDFFGNAATNNYWSVFNYHETVIYVGVFSLLAITGAIFRFKYLGKFKFFFFTLIISLLFIFNTPLGRAVYEYNVPLISTSAAGRISLLIVFAASALSGWWFDQLRKMNFKQVLRIYWFWPLIYLVIFITSFIIYKLYLPHSESIPFELAKAKTAWRNVIFPFGILNLFLLVIFLSRKTKLLFVFTILIICLDLFRFGWKYLPFVSSEFVYPDTPVTDFLKQDDGVFRVEREKAQILPPMTWAAYRLSSPSGYDPMAVKAYAGYYNRFLNEQKRDRASRYSELELYDAKKLGELNVKYFLSLKRDEENTVTENGEALTKEIEQSDWVSVFETDNVVVLKNKYFRERAYLLDTQGSVKITNYSPDKVVIDYEASSSGELVLMDTNYPGWRAYVNGEPREIKPHMEVFRKIEIPQAKGVVTFLYKPNSFYWGLRISLLSLLIWVIIYKYNSI